MSLTKVHHVSCLLITANVGTIFEDCTLLEQWFDQLKYFIAKTKPQFISVHCQEIGGKNYGSSMKNLSAFINKFTSCEVIIDEFDRIRIFFDEDFDCLEKFTALGSIYLIHKSIQSAKLYNFQESKFELVQGCQVFAGQDKCIKAQHVEKIKFPQDLFPECQSSRKGFMRTRWMLNDARPIDMVNIHLFHDASNIIAMENTPSPYAESRRKALEYALKTLAMPLDSKQSDDDSATPLFIFGDFNFRLNTNKVVQRITEGTSQVVKRLEDNDEIVEVIYHKRMDGDSSCNKTNLASRNNDAQCSLNRNDDSSSNNSDKPEDIVMTVGRKKFDCQNMDETFRATANSKWLLEMDNELESFKNELHEFNISFNPSYPFKEDETGGYSYMKTRCPAWCDRILFNKAGRDVILMEDKDEGNASQESQIEENEVEENHLYTLMGNSVPMGDHKPVLLYCKLSL